MKSQTSKGFTLEGRKRTLKNQRYVWGKQHNKMFQVADQVDVIITDGPLLLGLLYDETNDNSFLSAIYNSYLEFNNVNYFLIRNKKYNPAGRLQTEDEAKELDTKTKEMLFNYNIDFETGLVGGIVDLVTEVSDFINASIASGINFYDI